jgi:hypothetical protein
MTFKNARACEMLEKGSTKEEREAAHKARMEDKKRARARNYDRNATDSYIAANLSRNHPDYGMSVKDHWVEKTNRLAEKSS